MSSPSCLRISGVISSPIRHTRPGIIVAATRLPIAPAEVSFVLGLTTVDLPDSREPPGGSRRCPQTLKSCRQQRVSSTLVVARGESLKLVQQRLALLGSQSRFIGQVVVSQLPVGEQCRLLIGSRIRCLIDSSRRSKFSQRRRWRPGPPSSRRRSRRTSQTPSQPRSASRSAAMRRLSALCRKHLRVLPRCSRPEQPARNLAASGEGEGCVAAGEEVES